MLLYIILILLFSRSINQPRQLCLLVTLLPPLILLFPRPEGAINGSPLDSTFRPPTSLSPFLTRVPPCEASFVRVGAHGFHESSSIPYYSAPTHWSPYPRPSSNDAISTLTCIRGELSIFCKTNIRTLYSLCRFSSLFLSPLSLIIMQILHYYYAQK